VLGAHYSGMLGRRLLLARQCSARSGVLRVEVRPDEHRVLVSGAARTMIRGSFDLPQRRL